MILAIERQLLFLRSSFVWLVFDSIVNLVTDALFVNLQVFKHLDEVFEILRGIYLYVIYLFISASSGYLRLIYNFVAFDDER